MATPVNWRRWFWSLLQLRLSLSCFTCSAFLRFALQVDWVFLFKRLIFPRKDKMTYLGSDWEYIFACVCVATDNAPVKHKVAVARLLAVAANFIAILSSRLEWSWSRWVAGWMGSKEYSSKTFLLTWSPPWAPLSFAGSPRSLCLSGGSTLPLLKLSNHRRRQIIESLGSMSQSRNF